MNLLRFLINCIIKKNCVYVVYIIVCIASSIYNLKNVRSVSLAHSESAKALTDNKCDDINTISPADIVNFLTKKHDMYLIIKHLKVVSSI